MADYVVDRGTTANLGRIEGNLKVGHGAKIKASDGNLVYVTGVALFEGSAEIRCDFECDSLVGEHRGALKVDGDLTVRKGLDVAHSVECTGTIRAAEIDVGGKVRARSISSERVRVGGIVEVLDSLEGKTVEVGGKVRVMGPVKIEDLDVGGVAEVGGGLISGNIKVGGKFEARAPLEFGNLQVYGHTSLPSVSHGKKISTFGKLSVAGDLTCDEIDVEGVTDIHGNCSSKKIKVVGKLDVSGNLDSEELVNLGATEIEGDFKGSKLRIAGKFRARSAIISGEVNVVGFVETLLSIRAKRIIVDSGSRCQGPLIGDEVILGKSYGILLDVEKSWAGQLATLRLVGKMTRVEDIYAKFVHLGRVSTARRVYAEVVEVEEGVVVDEIQYTVELRGPVAKTHVEKPPLKVEHLPTPPP
jgi:cytoskeletal protein CcmA (bactofilin family)